jgi:hypothetical protein
VIISNILYAHLSYSHFVNKAASWYVIACVACGIISNMAWGLMMQQTKNNAESYILGQIWDFIPIFFFLVMPPIIYGIGLIGWRLYVGLFLIISGTTLISYADRY